MEPIDMMKQSVHYDEILHCITENLDVQQLIENYASTGNYDIPLRKIIGYAQRRICYQLCAEGLINNKVANISGFNRTTVNNYCNDYHKEFPKT